MSCSVQLSVVPPDYASNTSSVWVPLIPHSHNMPSEAEGPTSIITQVHRDGQGSVVDVNGEGLLSLMNLCILAIAWSPSSCASVYASVQVG